MISYSYMTRSRRRHQLTVAPPTQQVGEPTGSIVSRAPPRGNERFEVKKEQVQLVVIVTKACVSEKAGV
ncbi:hypothetical protein L249_1211 [Ophiocordyceps polyrhachis-furcata BCC 54312]|uniref:Uncharacterized protein n=1 Tax=Ophiocordyceps polyrhachis-furcata BCC 54312 TaxID=1330021 RepID=A0A367LEB5_9HYPO|nr:hypothetical protein L249_1211 [Ophiocordyceps polyrhachis-furcata BCC 54312]